MADGVARHPEYYNHKVHPDMKLPGDTRKLRDIKIAEVPTWLAKRDWTPIGQWFAVKRFANRVYTKYGKVKMPGANLFFIAGIWFGLANYVVGYKNTKEERLRKYH